MNEQNIIIYNTIDGKANVALYAKDDNIWMNQSQLAKLFDTSKQNVGQHIANILEENELDVNSVVKDFFTTASDGKKYNVIFYSLDMILALGFRIRSKRGTQFRIWANRNLKQYMQKGFVMDDDRLKNPDGRPDYFDELLERIREIRVSEKRFYQKVKDLFALCSDYDATDKATQMFFAETQNKLLYAVTHKTVSELIIDRMDSEELNMNLTSWKGRMVRKQDIFIAKNYLTENEIDILNRLTVIFLENAELRVKDRKDIPLSYWKDNVDKILEFHDKKVLKGTGTITHEKMEELVRVEYEKFNEKRKIAEAKLEDLQEIKELEELSNKLKAK